MSSDQPGFDQRDFAGQIMPYGLRPGNMELPGAEVFSLHSYFELLRRRHATIIIVATIVTFLAALYVIKAQPIYQATAKIEVDADTSPLQPNGDPSSPAAAVDDGYLQTQVDILKSNELAWQTIAQLGLEKSGLLDGSAGAGGNTLADGRRQQSSILQAFEKRLQVRLAPGSRIILVSFESTDPNLAQQVPNALVNRYLEYQFTAKYDSTRQVSDWMTKRLNDLKGKVETSEQGLVNYEKQNAVADLSNRGNLAQNTLDDLSRQLTAARTELAGKRALYDAMKTNPSATGLLTKDSLFTGLQAKYEDLQAGYAKALAEYGPAFYKVVQIQKQIDEVELLEQQERNREQAQVEADYRAASERVAILSRAVSQQKAQLQEISELQIPYNILKNEFQTNQQLYQKLLERLKDAEISAGLRATNAHILDLAPYPVSPVRPKRALDLAVGLFSGLLVGMTLAFVQEALDTSVKQPEDLEHALGAPVLGVIPEAASLPGWGGVDLARQGGSPAAIVECSVVKSPRSPIAEAYRALRTSILLLPPARLAQVLLFTSTQPREGKTSTCVNLALSLAQLNRRVLLIDADLRRGRIQSVLGLKGTMGLGDVLAGTASPRAVLGQVAEAPSLKVLPSGSWVDSPADLLSSPMLERMLGEFRQSFEFVLIDSPPLLLVADPAILSNLADGIVLVTASEITARKALWRALRILETTAGKLLGTVINRADTRREDYNYYRQHHRYYAQAESAHFLPRAPGGESQNP